MADYLAAWLVVRKHEGGYANDPADPGGATAYGISLRFARRLGLELDLDLDGDIDELDLQKLTPEGACRLYRRYFWDPNGYQELRDQTVACKMLDLAVNFGSRAGNRLAQRSLRLLGWDLPADGYCGPRTILALNGTPPRRFLPRVCVEQTEAYRKIAEVNPELEKFLAGWLKRARWPYTIQKETT